MYTSIILVALIAHSAISAPTNCGDYCDDQGAANYGHSSKSSYSSYSKSSSYGQHQMRGGFGATNGRLETLDENIVGQSGLNRPGNWKDEKHYVTDDGRGEMEYSAGQTVTNNGYSKYARHSYSYGTNDHHTPLPHSQILSSSDFNNELQNLRSRISSFMGNFNFGSESAVNSRTLHEFVNKASLITRQMNNVCDQVGVGSSMYDQMQQMMEEFQRNVEQKQREMEAIIYQKTTSSSSMTQETYTSVPSRPTIPYQTAPTIINNPTGPTVHEETLMEQRVEEEITSVQSLISSFYTNFNRPDASQQYQQDLNDQVNVINQKLNDLTYESIQNESTRTRIESLKSQFELYTSQIRKHIQDIEARHQADEQRRQERQKQLRLEKAEQEERLRKLDAERKQQEAARIYKLRLETEKKIRQEQDFARIQQERERQIQQAQQVQQVTIPQVTGSFEVTGSSTYQHSIKGSYHGSTSGGSQGTHNDDYRWSSGPRPQPLQPHVDLTAAMSRLQQDLNRLQNEVNNFNRYTMRLTSTNTASVVTEAERQAQTLRQNIDNLCETSSKYNNQDILSSAEELKRHFEELFQSFQSQAASYSSGSSFSSSGRYSSVRNPSITNVEMEHSKSTEIEIGRRPASSQRHSSSTYSASSGIYPGSEVENQLKHGLVDLGGGSGSQQQVDCVEMYAGQPCIEQSKRYRRQVGGK